VRSRDDFEPTALQWGRFLRELVFSAMACALLSGGGAEAMTYGRIPFQDGSEAIVARGRIEGNETARLLAALQSGSGAIPRTLIISSGGGDMMSALDLGQSLRQYGIRTVVGSIAENRYGQRVLGGGNCHSACVLVLMAGVSRSVLPGSRVGVHSPHVVMVSGGRTYMLDDATTRYMVQGTQPALRTYARQMGVSPAVIDAAHRVPHTSIRTLSPSELARYGLVTEGLPRVRPTAPRKRAAAARRTNG
jgi:hypothetical protein